MGTAPNGYQTPKTNWAAGNIPTAADFNRIEGNIQAVEEGSRTIDSAQAPTGNSGSLRQFLDWLANRIKVITGKTNWYDAPTKSLEQINTDLNAHLTDNTKHVTKDGTLQTGLNADQLDGAHAGTGANNVLKLDANGLVSLANIPATLTGKSADQVDGEDAATLKANARIQNTELRTEVLSAYPTGVQGRIFFHTGEGKFKGYTGTAWV